MRDHATYYLTYLYIFLVQLRSKNDLCQDNSCDLSTFKVERIGDYDQFECGLRVHNLEVGDRGLWLCEVEKYYTGFSRR